MIAVIDYGVGNLFSLRCSLSAVGADSVVTGDPEIIRAADRIILPGVGAFGDAAEKLKGSGMAALVKEQAAAGKPILGICLGMQLLFEKSYEYGEHAGLGLLRGEILPMEGRLPAGLKIPHIGWNALKKTKDSALLRYVKEGKHVYFVHSFYAPEDAEGVVATAEYGVSVTAAVEKDNIAGCQFHPEKSGGVGLSILRAFCEGDRR